MEIQLLTVQLNLSAQAVGRSFKYRQLFCVNQYSLQSLGPNLQQQQTRLRGAGEV